MTCRPLAHASVVAPKVQLVRTSQQVAAGPDEQTRLLTAQLADMAKADSPRFVRLIRRADFLAAGGMDRNTAYRTALTETQPL